MNDFRFSRDATIANPPVESDGYVRGGPKTLLRLEGATVLVCATFAFSKISSDWLQFALLFFVPDIAMLGYLFGRKTGALLYNAGHSYILPALLTVFSLTFSMPVSLAVGLIWIAHIGFDRAAGYGLKYETAFADTHLGRTGRSPRPTRH